MTVSLADQPEARGTVPSTAEVAVAIRLVSKRFGNVVALDSVSLDIRRGEFFSLLGPSGCGKTTLLRLIGGFESADMGDIVIDGASVAGLPPYRRPTNMIFQHLALFPHMNVHENVAFGLKRKGIGKAEVERRVRDALALVRLEGFGTRGIEQLSGGQKQRVAMARALVNDPSVLLLDEPLGALDLQLRLQLQDELRRLHRSLHSTFIFVTHDQSEALTMSDRIAVMEVGTIVQVGSPEEIYERPETRFVASFIGHTNLLEATVAEVHGTDRVIVDCAGTRFECLTDYRVDVGAPVTMSLRNEKIGIGPVPPGARRAQHDGVVVQKIFMGNIVRLQARLASGITLSTDISNVEETRTYAEGDSVVLSWDESSLILLRD